MQSAEELYNNLPAEVREEYEKKYSKEQFITSYNTLATAIEKMIPVIKKVAKGICEFANSVIKLYPNKRVVHLAKHGKGRTRKKNIHRIYKWLNREADNDADKR